MLSLQSPNSDTHADKSVRPGCMPRHECQTKAADVAILAPLLPGPHTRALLGVRFSFTQYQMLFVIVEHFICLLAEVFNAWQQLSSSFVYAQSKSTRQGAWTWPPVASRSSQQHYLWQKYRKLSECMCGHHVWPWLCFHIKIMVLISLYVLTRRFSLACCVILCERE